jgi:hypothetical protein
MLDTTTDAGSRAERRLREEIMIWGTALLLEHFPPADEVGEYVEKYRESLARIGFDPAAFARTYSVALRVTPERWRVW